MPKLRRKAGAEVTYIFEQFGFAVHAQRGSHIKLQRTGPSGEKQTLTIPNHRELDTGTLRAIIRQAGQYVPESELRACFYTD